MRRTFLIGNLLWVSLFLVSGLTVVRAQVMQSNNFQIQSDSINVGGGYSSSSNYQLESTAGEVATGDSASGSFNLRAGYQQMQEVYLAISMPADVSMSMTIPGITGGTSTGQTNVVVTTDSPAGYQLTIESPNSPAMQSITSNIPDYTAATTSSDFNFNYGPAQSYFGFSPEGTDVVSRFLDNGVDTCGIGSTDTVDKCWNGLSTTPQTIAQSAVSNHPNGATTTLKFMVGVGSGSAQEVGVYIATTTITALAL